MAALTFQAARANDNTHTVTRSTDDAIGSAAAALIMDNTLTKLEVRDAVNALVRHLNRQDTKNSSPADIATSGSDVE